MTDRCSARCSIYEEDEEPRASWICRAPLDNGRCPTHGHETTEAKQWKSEATALRAEVERLTVERNAARRLLDQRAGWVEVKEADLDRIIAGAERFAREYDKATSALDALMGAMQIPDPLTDTFVSAWERARAVLASRDLLSSPPAAETSIAPVSPADEAPGEPIASASSPPASTGERGGDPRDTAMAALRRAQSLLDVAMGDTDPANETLELRAMQAISALLDGWDADSPECEPRASGERSPRAGGCICPTREVLVPRPTCPVHGMDAPPPRSSGTTASEGGWCPNTTLRIPKGECGCCDDPEQGGES